MKKKVEKVPGEKKEESAEHSLLGERERGCFVLEEKKRRRRFAAPDCNWGNLSERNLQKPSPKLHAN